jgi:glyoxalase family protein
MCNVAFASYISCSRDIRRRTGTIVMQLNGIHHLTAVSADARLNHQFYTRMLGMRMVKKTVNQDDTSAYHLFYADGRGSPGTDLTFFEWPVPRERRGTDSISRTSLRVSGMDGLTWWRGRLVSEGMAVGAIGERAGRAALDFEDPEGQRLTLVDDGGRGEAHPWADSPIPTDYQIRGLGPITLTVGDLKATDAVLTVIMSMRPTRTHADPDGGTVHVYEMGDGGPAAELHIVGRSDLPSAGQGAGGVHHVAFRTTAHDYEAWTQRLQQFRVPSSGPVDRFYFRSLYFREPNGILFEIATDEPGFAADEPLETMGQRLALPPFLEARRAQIEAGLKPLG